MTTRTLLFGLDGLDHSYLDRLIGEGVLPNFKLQRDKSRRTDLGIYPGMGAGAFWASGATGFSPAHHGRYFFLQFDRRNYDVRPFHDTETYRACAFWKTLDADGKKVAVIDWHRAPFVKLQNGVVIDNWLGHDSPSGLKSWPPSLSRRLVEVYGHDPIAGGYASHQFNSAADHRAFGKGAVNRIEYKTRFCIDYLREKEWDIFIPCFTELHVFGHYYLHVSDSDHALFDTNLRDEIGEPLRNCYLAIDRAIGKICETAGPDATVMLFAGPGMEPLISANTAMDEIARKLDLGSAPVSSSQSIRNAYRSYIPNSLRMTIAPLARRARQLIADNDYKRRRFFAVPHNDNSGAIRVNLKGREKYGTIAAGPEYEAVLEEARSGLLSLRNAETGARAVSNVVFTHQELSGPYVDDLPDIFAIWDRTENDRNFIKLTCARTGDIVVPANLRTGDHTRTGVFWSTGADASIFAQDQTPMPHEITEIIIDSLH